MRQKILIKILPTFLLALLSGPAYVFAADININSEETSTQFFTENNQTMTIGAGGNIAVPDFSGSAIQNYDFSGSSIVVDTGNASTGISSGVGDYAIEFAQSYTSGLSGKLSSLTLTSGRITSNNFSGATVYLFSQSGINTSISLASGTSILNEISSNVISSNAIIISSQTDTGGGHADSDISATISNAGTISSNNGNVDSAALSFSDVDPFAGNSSYTVNNTGVISSTTAIYTANGDLALTNSSSGSIVGNIIVGANSDVDATQSSTIVNSGSATISGNITAARTELDLSVNGGTITGNIDLGNNTGSTIALGGGAIVGNITMGNANQITTFNSGSVAGTIDGGKIIFAGTTTLNGNIGSNSVVNNITVNANVLVNAYTNNNSINATNISLNNNSYFQLGTGTFTGTIDGVSAYKGIVDIRGNNTIGTSAVIGSTNGIQSLRIVGGTVNLDQSVKASQVYLGIFGIPSFLNLSEGKTITGNVLIGIDASILKLGNGSSVAGAIDGNNFTNGTLAIDSSASVTAAGNIGANYSLTAINLLSNSTLNASTYSIRSTNLTMSSGSVLNLNSAGFVAAVDGAVANQGTINLNNTRTLESGTTLGSTNGLFAINIANGVTITANDSMKATTTTLGASSTLSLATNKSITGDVMLGTSAILTLDAGSSVSGTTSGLTDGVGTINFTGSSTLAGNMGTNSNSLATISISGGTVDASSYNIDATNISISSTGTLSLGTGSTNGAITLASGATLNISDTAPSGLILGSSDAGDGTVNLNGTTFLVANIGEADNKISAVNIAFGQNISISNKDIISNTLSLAGFSSLNSIGGNITGNIFLEEQSSLVVGNSTLSGTINGNAENLKGALTIADGYSFTTNNNIGSTYTLDSINIGANSTLDAETNNNDIVASKIILYSGATLDLGTGAISDVVRGYNSGDGTVNINADRTLVANLGNSEKYLGTISVASTKSLNAGSNTIYANDIILASSSTLTTSASSFDSSLIMNSGTTFAVDSTTVSGTINSASGLQGVINSSGSVDFYNIGNTHSIAELDVLSGRTSFHNDVAIDQINVAGILSLENATAITGNVSVSDGGFINLNQSAQTISEDFTAASGSAIMLEINSTTSAASLTVVGVATISASTVLHVSFADGTTAGGSSYTIVSGGAGSSISAISNANINVNSGGSNTYNSLTFTTQVVGNNLLLNVTSVTGEDTPAPAPTPYVQNPNQSAVNDAINNIENASGELAAIQNYLNSDAVSNENKTNALKSILPETDNSLNRIAFNNSNTISDIVAKRIDVVRSSVIQRENFTTSPSLTPQVPTMQDPVKTPESIKYIFRSGVSSGDEIKKDALWIQPFGSNTKQSNTASAEGYKANSFGLAFGADTKISKDNILGISLAYASSNIKSQNALQSTNINSYQINLYNGYNHNNYFFNNVIGFVWNDYRGSRAIPVTGVVAKSDYSGQSYFARFEFGARNQLPHDFILTPTFMITAAHNSIADYNEKNAGTLNLSVTNKDSNFLEGRIGLEIARYFEFNKKKLLPQISASYGYDFIGDEQKSTARFIGQTSSFATTGAKVAQGNLKLGTGIQFFSSDLLSISLDYVYESRVAYRSHYGSLRARVGF